MSITRDQFGTTADGSAVERYRLRNIHGLEAEVITYGGTLTALRTPDRTGALADIVLGFDSLEPYLGPHPYFGSLIGRYANRIARGRFALNGVAYQLATNNGPNHLHGGPGGFHTAIWQAQAEPGDSAQRLTLRHQSHAGDEGYPGTLQTTVVYSLGDDNALEIDYTATTDQETIVNLTNHSYFNLAGGGDVLGHELQIAAELVLPVDETQIPSGELRPVRGTPLDFTALTPIGAQIMADDAQLRGASQGYDHNWVLDHGGTGLGFAARVREPQSGRTLEVWTTQPGLQFYSANFLTGSIEGKGGRPYHKYAALCLETQHFPDSPNQPGFPSTLLRPGETYRQTTVYRFGAT